MPRVKQASRRKRGTKTVPVLGAAGLTFSLVGGASAAVAPNQDQPRMPNLAPGHQVMLGEEEISDVSLATFYVFDRENSEAAKSGVQVAWRGCGGCILCRLICGSLLHLVRIRPHCGGHGPLGFKADHQKKNRSGGFKSGLRKRRELTG